MTDLQSLLDSEMELTLAELARTCATDAEWLIDLVGEGILEPTGRSIQEWRFSGICIARVQRVQRLQRDLDVNLAGTALVLDMLDELEILRRRIAVLDPEFHRPRDSS